MRRTRRAGALLTVATVVGAGLTIGPAPAAWAATFTVTTAADDGPGSLRAAITSANAAPGADTIVFDLEEPVIQLETVLPTVTEAVTIDALGETAQVTIDATNVTGDDVGVLTLDAPSTVRGLAMLGFGEDECTDCWLIDVLDDGDGSVVDTNLLGTDAEGSDGTDGNGVRVREGADDVELLDDVVTLLSGIGVLLQGDGAIVDGNAVVDNEGDGIQVFGADAVIGGVVNDDPVGNLISGNDNGVFLGPGSSGAWVYANWIGTTPDGLDADGNSQNGVLVLGGQNHAIGDEPPPDDVFVGDFRIDEYDEYEEEAAGNVIAANEGDGVRVALSAETLVSGNAIGLNAAGDPLGNGGAGVFVEKGFDFPDLPPIETLALEEELPDLPDGVGRVVIERNGIDTNGDLGIDLDEGDIGEFPFPGEFQSAFVVLPFPLFGDIPQPPVITGASAAGGGQYQVQWNLGDEEETEYRVEFFVSPACDPSGSGEGREFLGDQDGTTDDEGDVADTALVDAPSFGGTLSFTATATGPDGTSEFSECFVVTPPAGPLTEVGGETREPIAEARTITDACPPGRVPDRNFPDVPAANPHRDAVNCIAWWQVTIGKRLPGGAVGYAPLQDVTRGQLASFLARLIRRTGGTLPAGPNAFRDDDSSAHAANIDALFQAGIVEGFPDGTFRPDAPIRRDQLASFVARAATYRRGVALPAGPDFFDDDDGNEHEANIQALALAGIVQGTAPRLYSPLDDLTRQQMASSLVRLLDLLVEEGLTTPPGA